jgi:hypothetical protein
MNRNAESQNWDSQLSCSLSFFACRPPGARGQRSGTSASHGMIDIRQVQASGKCQSSAKHHAWQSVYNLKNKLLTMIASVLLRNSGYASQATRARVVGLRFLSSGPKSAAAPNSNVDEDNILPVRGNDDADWVLECPASPPAFIVASMLASFSYCLFITCLDRLLGETFSTEPPRSSF